MIRNCKFAYKCTKLWSNLERSENPDIKFCGDCKQHVYFVHNEHDLLVNIRLNRCVAISGVPIATVASHQRNRVDLRLSTQVRKRKKQTLLEEFDVPSDATTEEDKNRWRGRLIKLIKLGEVRGYLIHGEIAGHLSSSRRSATDLEPIIGLLNDLGISVYEDHPISVGVPAANV